MEDGMKKLMSACVLLFVIAGLHTNVFASSLNCTFKNAESKVEGIETLQISNDHLVINQNEAIQLEHTRIKCGQFGKQHRFDGLGNGLQVILKSCTDEAALEGHLIDSINSKVAEVICDEVGL
jgi:hypothetical protein